MLGLGPDPGDQRVRTRFVVDIVSGTSAGAMNTGSIAIALRAEYGEFWPSCISFTGRS